MSFDERFDAEGWLRIGGLFDVGLLDDLRGAVERELGEMGPAGRKSSYLRVGDERLMMSVRLAGPFLDPRVYAQPLLLRLLEQLIGPDFLIDSVTCVVALAGAGEQRLHQDHPPLFRERPPLGPKLPAYAVTVVIPLIDLTSATGTTKLFSKTHRGAEPDDGELPYLSRGECVLMDYRLLHQGTANRSAKARPVLYVVYVRPWFTDVVNFETQPRINMDPADLQAVPEAHRALFGRVAEKRAGRPLG